VIDEAYGIFVSPQGSDTTGAGTRAAPYKTLAKALQRAKGNGNRVYACDEGTGYAEAVTIDATLDGMSLYGGFECAGWTYATTRRARVHPTSGVALTVQALTAGLTVEDVEFDAPDAPVGQSSIGAIVETSANVVLRRVKVASGKGGAGTGGVDGTAGDKGDTAGAQQDGLAGGCFLDGGAVSQPGGGWLNPSTCGSTGGGGGTAFRGPGTAGVYGLPQTNVDPAGVDNRGHEGATGEDGKAGSPGTPGDVGTAVPAGTFTATGYTPGPGGGAGTEGHVGQGGGGGGASNAMAAGCMGASGGAGGMGGCGGTKGTGGTSAGASVALLAWTSAITLDACQLIAADGGVGGNGGSGGTGGKGAAGGKGGAGIAGDAATGVGKGGSGGVGGDGGLGGPGAGGNGGPSYALVYKGTAPTRMNGTSLGHGGGGARGVGAGTAPKAPDGTAGAAADELVVP
jgi:hypothetical protein